MVLPGEPGRDLPEQSRLSGRGHLSAGGPAHARARVCADTASLLYEVCHSVPMTEYLREMSIEIWRVISSQRQVGWTG